MVGKASVILVVGFAMIFGIINLNIAGLTRRSVGGMVGYNESALSRIMASSGANMGMAIFSSPGHSTLRHTILNKDFTTGNFKGAGFTVTIDSVPKSGINLDYIRLRSVSRCTTFVKTSKTASSFYVISDTVEVRMDAYTGKSFSELGWMSVTENGVSFATGDTLYGKVHSNGQINTMGAPVFKDKVTTSQTVKKASGSVPVYLTPPPEEHVPTRDFPTDLNNINLAATNKASTQNVEIFVTLNPGTSADNDGYAIISTVTSSTAQVHTGLYDNSHPPKEILRTVTNYAAGTKLDSINLSGSIDNVIYTTQNVHVLGTLDGSLSIASGSNSIRVEGDVKYEHEPNQLLPLSDPVNKTTDMLGLVAYKNIIVSENSTNNKNDLIIDAGMFTLTGSFTAENYSVRGEEGYIKSIGSIAQAIRGPIAQPGPPYTGFHKLYKYDPRMSPPAGSTNPDGSPMAKKSPPVFPGWKSRGPLAIQSWWESTRKPFDVNEFY